MNKSETDVKNRCFGNGEGKAFYAAYHDDEWGVPVYDDRLLFEMLILEGAQAGLSWETILRKREGYRAAFHGFAPEKVAAMKDDELEALRYNPEIIRNRLKIYATRKNASIFLDIQKNMGHFLPIYGPMLMASQLSMNGKPQLRSLSLIISVMPFHVI